MRRHPHRLASTDSTGTYQYFLTIIFMPDHLHLIIEGVTEHSRLERFVRIAKQRAGFQFVRVTGERLWQESYFDRTLRKEESLPEVVRYVVNNPVRAGLVESPADYEHWGSSVWSREELLEYVGVESIPRV
jgi:REP element-mobilizing transposase RayT